jgi:hypothetical protein
MPKIRLSPLIGLDGPQGKQFAFAFLRLGRRDGKYRDENRPRSVSSVSSHDCTANQFAWNTISARFQRIDV